MKIYYIIITILLSTKLLAETNPPKVTTQQFQNWTYQCVEDEKKKTCEVSQNIRIQNSNINFSIVYNKFLNESKDTKKSITIIAPLGVDLNTQLALRFNGTGQININWTTCEQVGCLVYLTDNSKDEKMINLYKKIYDSLNKSQSLEIAVKTLVGNQPIAVQSNLNGFNAAAKKLDSEKSS